jgi:hypothetical protein
MKRWKKSRRQRKRGLIGNQNATAPLSDRHGKGWFKRHASKKVRRANRKKRLPT